MRRLADTLPTLDGPVPSLGPAESPPEFETGAILKALTAPRVGGRPEPAPEPTSNRADRPRRDAPVFVRGHSTPGTERERSNVKRGPAAPKPGAASKIPSFDAPVRRNEPDKLADAVAAARKVAEKACEIRVNEAREEERKIATEQLEAERICWSHDIATALSGQLDTAIETIRASLSEALATALGPVLTTAMTKQAVEQFSNRIDRILTPSSGSAPLTIKGPQVLLEALRQARGGDTEGLRLVPSGDAELTATVNETTLRTTVRAFSATLGTSTGHRHGTK